MNENFLHKLETLVDRFKELEVLLGDPLVIGDQGKFKQYAKEYHQLQPLVECSNKLGNINENIELATMMLEDNDTEVKQLAQHEIVQNNKDKKEILYDLQILLLPVDPDDVCNVFLEIRAGTGGDEAAIFCGDLFRMYSKYAENNKWKVELVSSNPSEKGGFKEIIVRISGGSVYAALKFESGAHRVQRIPETESQGRVHTSACTVAILKEVEQVDGVDIKSDDLKIDTFRASGAGGQHVNKTDSAIRITHIPSGIVVECQDDRSQHKNRSKAMSLLQSKLLTIEKDKQKTEEDEMRRKLVGSGDRSDRIRTYNFPQGRITDHRINLTLYKLHDIMEGALEQVTKPLVSEHQMDQLTSLGLS